MGPGHGISINCHKQATVVTAIMTVMKVMVMVMVKETVMMMETEEKAEKKTRI